METLMPTNRLTLVLASLAMGSVSAWAQAPSSSTSPPPASPTASAPGGVTFMTEMRSGMWRASKLEGMDVYNNGNEKIGDISELILDQAGRVEAVVIGVGGFLGLGEHNVAVPFEQIRWSSEPVRSARTSPPPPSSSTPGGAPDRADITGAIRSTTGDMLTRGYPDHALLNMTREQLRAAPQFKYAIGGSPTNR
jgi:sporulation protein YlmC with PRC-barrel domain